MATEAQRAPRIPAHATSMAALAAAPSNIETPLAAAWAAVWNGCGGALIIAADGKRSYSLPLCDGEPIETPYADWTADERRGAMKALLALVDLAGSDAVGAIFGIPQEKTA